MEDRGWKTAAIHHRNRQCKETVDMRELIAKR
jgi:hypothetical protein